MILDDVQPTWDDRRIESRLVLAPAEIVYRAVVETDYLEAVRSSRAARALSAIRCGIERLVSAVLGRTVAPMAEPATLKLVDIPRRGQWVKLGEDSPGEIAFGAIGRPHFSLPGNAKIGCHILLDPQDGGTRITYEAGTSATDRASRRGFLRYWHLVSPIVGVVMRSTLSVIARNVNRAGCDASRREKACV